MSEIKVNSIKGVGASAAAITVNNSDGTCTANLTNKPNRNLIINGAMQVAQRGTSFAEASSIYTLDRFRYYRNIDTGEVTISQQAVTDLAGFTKALKVNTTTAETGIPSKSGAKYSTLIYRVEAQDLQHIANGTSSAKPLTLSFYVKSNVTGTFCVSIYKSDNTARLVSLPYTINSANTWEQKTLSIPADTSGGGINNDNGEGYALYWIFARQQGYQGTTSTSWINYVDTGWANLCTASIFENVNDHIFITGVQLEVGSVATDFEHRSFAQELALCQRYYFGGATSGTVYYGSRYHADNSMVHVVLPVLMRTTPTVVTPTIGGLTGSGALNSIYENNQQVQYYVINDTSVYVARADVKCDAEL